MSSFSIKIIAAITMLIDHIGFAIFPNNLLLRIIGRISMPLFAFQIAIGFEKTRNREKYILRMLIFAIVSQLPFYLMYSTQGLDAPLNIGFTFLLSLLILYSFENIKNIWGKIICITLIVLECLFLDYDYYISGAFLVILFFYTRKNKSVMAILYSIFTVIYAICVKTSNAIAIFEILALIPLLTFNDKKGYNIKYLFYIFYPLHMLLIYFFTLR